MRIDRFIKKMAAAAACVLVAGSLLAGCASGSGEASAYDPQAVCARYGDTEISAAEVSYYVRDAQSMYEMMYGSQSSDLWNMQISEYVTLEDAVKESTLNEVHQTYILMDHADDVGVALTDDQIALAHDAADRYYEANQGAATDAIGIEREEYYPFFEHNALAVLVHEAAVADVDTNVSDEEARHCTVQVLRLDDASSDYDAEAVKDEVLALLEGGSTPEEAAAEHEEEGLSFTEYQVGAGEQEDTFGQEAMSLAEGEFTAIHSDEAACWYVVYCSEYMNEAATESGRAQVISQRQAEAFDAVYAEWRESAPEFVVDEDVLASIDMSVPMTSSGVSVVQPGSEDETEG